MSDVDDNVDEEYRFDEKEEVCIARLELAVKLEKYLIDIGICCAGSPLAMNCVGLLLQARMTSVEVPPAGSQAGQFSHIIKGKISRSRDLKNIIKALEVMPTLNVQAEHIIEHEFYNANEHAIHVIEVCKKELQANEIELKLLKDFMEKYKFYGADIPRYIAIALRVIVEKFSQRKLVRSPNSYGLNSGKINFYDTLRDVYDLMDIKNDSRAPANKAFQVKPDDEIFLYCQEYFDQVEMEREDYLEFIRGTLRCPASLFVDPLFTPPPTPLGSDGKPVEVIKIPEWPNSHIPFPKPLY